jgi:type II secretory pathway pseudopilin PulG
MSNLLGFHKPGAAQRRRAERHRGFALLSLLVLLALAGYSIANFTQSTATALMRDKELALLWVGQQYRDALESYYEATPGKVKTLPVKFEDLLLDPRFPQPVRHIRKLYKDPMAPDSEWGVLRVKGQIMGIYSNSTAEPFQKIDFDPGLETFNGAKSYSEWRFVWLPRRLSVPVQGGSPPRPSSSVLQGN